MRADRLLSILLLLQAHGRLTAGALAQRLEVSERTIYRDMEALSGAGVPVVADRGPGGGWSLLEEYRTTLTGLNLPEVQALFLAGPARPLADLGLDKAAEAALLKLLAALPAAHQRDVALLRGRIHIDPAGWSRSDEDVSCLPALQEAVWTEQQLAVVYRRSDGAEVERIVDPLGLVAKGSLWYLVAAVDGEVRTYRVSRVLAAAPTGRRAERPADFDLAAFWSQSTSEFVANLPRYPAMLRVDPAILYRVRGWRFATVEHVSDGADGWLIVQVRFEVEDDACASVLGGGAQIEVIDPPALREAVLRAARAVVARYEGSS